MSYPRVTLSVAPSQSRSDFHHPSHGSWATSYRNHHAEIPRPPNGDENPSTTKVSRDVPDYQLQPLPEPRPQCFDHRRLQTVSTPTGYELLQAPKSLPTGSGVQDGFTLSSSQLTPARARGDQAGHASPPSSPITPKFPRTPKNSQITKFQNSQVLEFSSLQDPEIPPKSSPYHTRLASYLLPLKLPT